jgi:hypothetical protein
VVLACIACLAAVAMTGLTASFAASCTTFNGLSPGGAVDSGGGDVTPDSPDSGPNPPGYLSLADAARLCSRVVQCPALATDVIASTTVPVDANNYSLCLHWLTGPIPPDRVGFAAQQQAFTCMLKAATCADAAACLYEEPLSMTDPRCADAGVNPPDTCIDNGNTVLSCYYGYALHCNSPYYQSGTKCLHGMIGDAGDVGCALGTNCVNGAGCSTFYDYCGIDNLHYSLDCAVAGYSCDTAADASTVCDTAGTYTACNTRGAMCSADMNSVTVCDGYEVSTFDCASLTPKGTCSRKDGPGRCVRPGDTCSPFDMTSNQCTQTSISLCIGGQPASFDCASIGLKCVPTAGSVSGHCG